MVFPRARLAVSALLFVAWISFLFYLVLITRDTIVVSRPQILVADLLVVAQLHQGENGKPATGAVVERVLWPGTEKDLKEKSTILLEELQDIGEPQGWRGPGSYVLPLRRKGSEQEPRYELTPLPQLPPLAHPRWAVAPRIYPATKEVLRQLHEIKQFD